MKLTYRGDESFWKCISQRLAESGFEYTEKLGDAEAILTFCTSESQLEDMYFGDNGIIGSATPHTLLVDISATTPGFAREMSALATVSDLAFVEAPMCVRNMVAEQAFKKSNLTCYAACEGDIPQLAKSLLDALFGDVQAVGSPGAAQLARAAETLQRVSEMLSAIEADALFNAAKKSVSSVEMKGSAPQPLSPEAYMVLNAVKDKRFEGDFTCEMLYGELVASIMSADDFELILPQAEAASHMLELLAVVGGAQKSPAALALVYRDEGECAENGLDWSNAQVVYGTEDMHLHDDLDGEEDLYGLFDGDDDDGFAFSAN